MSSAGGFTFFETGGGLSRDIYVFPTKLLSSKDREYFVKQFVAKLYGLNGGQPDEVDKILTKIAPAKECNKSHTLEPSKIGSLSSNVEILPEDGFRKPEVKLANSTPGPRLSKVRDITTVRSPSDSLRVINHLQLSNDDCRYIRGISLVGLSSEYSVTKLKASLMGNEGKGWVEARQVSVKQWFRNKAQEVDHYKNGQPVRKSIVIGSIDKVNLKAALQNFADKLTELGQYLGLESLEDCPESLKGVVAVLVCGNDSGQGYCREGVRFVNRINSNSGSKVFITTLMEGSDKSLSLFQKQALFSTLSSLRNLSSIHIGGQVRQLIKISCMDYEAAAEDVGQQVCNL